MLIKAKTVQGYTLDSYDGEFGKVMDFYFDDRHWTIRYLVADTGNWLVDRQVLISPYALVEAVREAEHITVNLSRKQIEDCPLLESDKPVSQQYEADYNSYYDWPTYWAGPFMWGAYPYITREGNVLRTASPEEKAWDPHLRSTREVTGYHIQSSDGEIGHVEDFIIDDETWAIRYLVVDTENWLPGKKVLVSPHWITRVSWSESKVFVHLTREIIEQSPEYTDDFLLTRSYEAGLHRHYNRKGYWME